MEPKVVWTPQAVVGLEKVLKYLEREWTRKEINKLQMNLNKVIRQIKRYPALFPAPSEYPELRKALIDKNNYLVYRFDNSKNAIIIINFRGTRQSPSS